MRQVPRLEFVLDDSLKQAFETVQAIDSAMAELGQKPPWESATEAEPADEEGPAGGDASTAARPADYADPPVQPAQPGEEDR